MSNLLEKASIVTTPTSYDNGKILSVKPSIVLGNELVTNGDFATDSDWTKGTGWSISGGKAIYTGTANSDLAQSGILTSGKLYKLEYEVVSSTLVNGIVKLSGVTASAQNVLSQTTGVHSLNFIANGTTPTSFNIRVVINTSGQFEIDNVSVKEVIDGDFDFTRNSSATRVNSQGLIEDMQILSGDLVSNGDFSQEGSELVTNGDFSNGANNWSLGTGWSIGVGNVIGSSASGTLSQNGIASAGKQYKVTFNITDYSSGTLYVDIGGSPAQTATGIGLKTFYFTSTSTGSLRFYGGSFTGSIDNVSVKEVGQDWTLGTGWSIGDNKIIHSSGTGQASRLEQSGFNNTSLYKITITTTNKGSNTYRFYNGAGANIFILEGTNTYLVTGLLVGKLLIEPIYHPSGDVEFTNISVIEITDDTNLPRIDYTGGVGHWLFEPQSTNLITYSEDISQSSWVKQSAGVALSPVVTASYAISPDGGLNASRVIFNTGGGSTSSDFSQINDPVVVSIGNVTTSVYIKSNTASNYTMSLLNAFGSYTSILVTTEWQRFQVSVAAVSTSSSFRLRLRPTEGTSSVADVLVWGAQVEEQSYATSYIPTSGSTVTRLQDAANGAGSSDLINSTEGVLYAEVASFISLDTTEPNRYITLTNGTSNQRIALLLGGNPNQLRAIAYSNTQSINLSFTTSLTDAKQFNKLAIKYKSGDYAFFLNGIKIGGSTETNIFTANTLNDLSFDVGGGTQKFRGKVKCVAVYKEALTDAELTCLTTI